MGEQGVDPYVGDPRRVLNGHRRSFKVEKEDIPTNHLFQEMIRVIERISPRCSYRERILFFQGTLRREGRDIQRFKTSSMEGYRTTLLLHAYGFGVPQNRPRVMIMGIRDDILSTRRASIATFDPSSSTPFNTQLRNNGGLFPKWEGSSAPDLRDAIGDLEYQDWVESEGRHRNPPSSDFQREMRSVLADDELTDHNVSNHSPRVRGVSVHDRYPSRT